VAVGHVGKLILVGADERAVDAAVRVVAPQCRHIRGVVRAANVSPDAPLEILGLN
jgi:hypothetical protein